MEISTRYDVTDIVICVDCAAMHANGTLGADESADVAHSDAMVAHMGTDVMRLALACRHDDDDDDSGSAWHDNFSSAQCGACGTYLAGDRCHAVILTEKSCRPTARALYFEPLVLRHDVAHTEDTRTTQPRSETMDIKETIRHGSYFNERTVTVDALTPDAFDGLMATSAYRYAGRVGTNDTTRAAYEALSTAGGCEIGWSTFVVVPEEVDPADVKRAALADHTGDDIDDITVSAYDDNLFDAPGRSEWLIVDDETADRLAADQIGESLWAFRPSFLADATDVPQVAFEKLSELYDDANPAVRAIIESTCGMSEFVSDAIAADGRGHFLSQYDGEEVELNIAGETFFAYRVN